MQDSPSLMSHAVLDQTFRLRKGYRNHPIVFLVFCIAMGVANAYSAWVDAPNDHRAFEAMFPAIFWGGWACLALWLLVFYHRARLQITNDRVTEGGIEIDLDRVNSVRWQTGGVKLVTDSTKIAIRLDNFEPAVQLRLIRFLRKRLPEEIQTGWGMFCYRVAVPLRERTSGLDRVPNVDEVRVTRRRWDWYFLPAIALSSVIGVVAYWKYQQARLLTGPVMLAFYWLILRYSTPRRGHIDERMDPRSKRFLLIQLICLAVPIGGIILSEWLKLTGPQAATLGGAAFVFWLAQLPYHAHRLDVARKNELQAKAEAAAQRWDEGESNIAAGTAEFRV